MSFTGRYRVGLYAGIFGAIAMAIIHSLSTPQSMANAQRRDDYRASVALQKERIQAEGAIERERAQQTRLNADIYRENNVRQIETLSITGYTDNPDIPPELDPRLFADPSKKVFIFDGANACVGYWQQKNFYWRHTKGNESVCDGMKN
jgi:hypothetical protein